MTVGGPWSRQRVELDVPGLSIAAGQSYKWFPEIKFGAIDDFDNNDDNGTIGTLPAQGGTQIYPYQDTPFDLEVVSDDASDTELGTGARRVLVQGLDEDWLLQTVYLAISGTTAVAVPNPAPGKQWLRIISFVVTASGTNGVNAGNITAQIAGGGTQLMNILVRAGHSIFALTTIPADFVGFIKTWQLVAMPEGGIEGGGAGQLPQFVGGLMLRNNDPQYDDPAAFDPAAGDLPTFYTADVSAGEVREVIVPFLLPPKTDVELRLFNVDINNAAICGNFQIVARRLTPEEQNGSEILRRWVRNWRVFV